MRRIAKIEPLFFQQLTQDVLDGAFVFQPHKIRPDFFLVEIFPEVFNDVSGGFIHIKPGGTRRIPPLSLSPALLSMPGRALDIPAGQSSAPDFGRIPPTAYYPLQDPCLNQGISRIF